MHVQFYEQIRAVNIFTRVWPSSSFCLQDTNCHVQVVSLPFVGWVKEGAAAAAAASRI